MQMVVTELTRQHGRLSDYPRSRWQVYTCLHGVTKANGCPEGLAISLRTGSLMLSPLH